MADDDDESNYPVSVVTSSSSSSSDESSNDGNIQQLTLIANVEKPIYKLRKRSDITTTVPPPPPPPPPPATAAAVVAAAVDERPRKTRKTQRENANERITEAQRRSQNIGDIVLISTFKTALRHIGLNFEEQERRMFSQGAHEELHRQLLAEVLSILALAKMKMDESGRSTLLGRDVMIAALEYLDPQKYSWSRNFATAHRQALADGIDPSEDTLQLFCDILRQYM